MRCLVVLTLVVLVSGCAVRRPQISSIVFRDCKVVEDKGKKLGCECKDIAWMVDAKTGAPVALCGAKKR